MLKRLVAIVMAGASLAVPAVASAQPEPPAPRSPLLDIPEGCPTQILADTVVFVGTVSATDYRTVRYRIDQPRAGDLGRFASQVDTEYFVDVRYGVDTKYLHEGSQYLVGATLNPNVGLLESKVAPERQSIGENEVINANETDEQCPELSDPKMTMHVDGTSIDAGMLTPLFDDSRGMLSAVLTAAGLVLGGILALAALRWLFTGLGRGVESMARTSSQSPQARSAVRAREALPAGARGRSDVPPARPRNRR